MAKAIIEGMTGEFNPEEYRDEYRQKVQEAIERKIAGKEIVSAERKGHRHGGQPYGRAYKVVGAYAEA